MIIDGVSWAAGEIVGFMILATLVGLAIGWIFGRWLQRETIAEYYRAELNEQSELARKAEHRLVESNLALDKLQEQLRDESEKVGELEAQLGSSQQTVSDLAVELAAAGGSDDELSQVRQELDAARSEVEQQRGELKALHERLDERDRAVGDLEAGLATAEGRAGRAPELDASRAVVAESPAEDLAEPPAGLTKDEARSRISEVAGRTAGGLPPADDDLKKIRGIGPKLESMLKEMGITSFRQVANFAPDDIAIVTAALDAFKGRIERDDWMSSAAEQHIEKYSEPA